MIEGTKINKNIASVDLPLEVKLEHRVTNEEDYDPELKDNEDGDTVLSYPSENSLNIEKLMTKIENYDVILKGVMNNI